MKKVMTTLICAALIVSMAGCTTTLSGNKKNTSTTQSTQGTSKALDSSKATENNTNSDSESKAEKISEDGYKLTFSDRDLDPSYDEGTAVKIAFSGKSASVIGDGASADGSKVTVTKEGTYVISGKSTDGQICVKADDKSKVQLVLDGVDLTSSSSPIVVESADKVFVTIKDGTENTLSDASNYTLTADSSNVDSAIFSKSDLTINGTGKLTVNGNYKHGIVSKDDLIITGGNISVKSKNAGIEGKDSVRIKTADITVDAGSDAIRSTNTEKTDSKGYVYIESGTFNLTANNDGIQAVSLLRVADGDFTVKTGGGNANGKTHSDGGFRMDMYKSNSDSTDTESAKALKCAADIKVTGGTFNIDSSDDAVHSDNSVEISAGTLKISTGDDGIHASSTLTVDGGTINIEKSYEGLEGGEITINDGKIIVHSSDDGFNAAGGSDGNVEKGAFDSDSSKKIFINGGYIYVDADGDGLDSNGILKVTGGVILVNGPENNGNGTLDYGTSAEITGGTLVALGSSGMAETITPSGSQGTIMTDIDSQSGKSFVLTDSDGNVIASLNSSKTYSNVVVSSADIKSGKTYKIVCGGTVSGADSNGYANSGKVGGGSETASVEMTSNNYSSGGGHGMGGFGNGGGGPQGDMGSNGGMRDNRGQLNNDPNDSQNSDSKNNSEKENNGDNNTGNDNNNNSNNNGNMPQRPDFNHGNMPDRNNDGNSNSDSSDKNGMPAPPDFRPDRKPDGQNDSQTDGNTNSKSSNSDTKRKFGRRFKKSDDTTSNNTNKDSKKSNSDKSSDDKDKTTVTEPTVPKTTENETSTIPESNSKKVTV